MRSSRLLLQRRVLQVAAAVVLGGAVGSAAAQGTVTSASSSASFSFPTFPSTPGAPAAPGFPGFGTSCQSQAPTPFNGSIVDAAVSTPELSTLAALVQAAGLVPALSAPGFKTVFAPTNAAFAKIPAPVVSTIVGNVPILTKVLTYHVIAGAKDPRSAFLPQKVATLEGGSVFFSVDGTSRDKVQVNNSNVTCKGVLTNNGIVYIIDSVLQPQYR